jgi:valyl-tRNA synthetase
MNGGDAESADSARRVLVWVMSNTLKLLHPFMPYITEEIWQTLPHEGEALIVVAGVRREPRVPGGGRRHGEGHGGDPRDSRAPQ